GKDRDRPSAEAEESGEEKGAMTLLFFRRKWMRSTTWPGDFPLPSCSSSRIIQMSLLHPDGPRGASPDDARQPTDRHGGPEATAKAVTMEAVQCRLRSEGPEPKENSMSRQP